MALYREREGWPRAGVANDVSTEYYKSHQGQHLYSNQFVHFWPLEIFLPTGWPNTFPRSTGEGEKKKKEATLPRLPHRKTLGLLALGKKPMTRPTGPLVSGQL